jgi:hypothetical protein
MPTYGKWKKAIEALKAKGIKPLQKVDVAYEILDLLSANPSRQLIDPRLAKPFAKAVRAVSAHFEKLELERQRGT